MILKPTNQIGIVLSATPATQIDCLVSYRDRTSTTYTTASNLATSNGTTDTIILGAPAAGTQRIVDYINIFNNNAGNVTLSIFMLEGATKFILTLITLQSSERLEFNGSEFISYTTTGAVKSSQTNLTSPISSARNQLVLSSPVTNNNAVANTLQDTGLEFLATLNKVYYFNAMIFYTAAATTTGSRWVLNSAGVASRIQFSSKYSLTTTTSTINSRVSGYNLPAAANATSATTTANLAELEGFIVITTTDLVKIRFASEVAGSAIVALAGSFIEFQEVF